MARLVDKTIDDGADRVGPQLDHMGVGRSFCSTIVWTYSSDGVPHQMHLWANENRHGAIPSRRASPDRLPIAVCGRFLSAGEGASFALAGDWAEHLAERAAPPIPWYDFREPNRICSACAQHADQFPETELQARPPVFEGQERDRIRSALTAVALRPSGSVSIQQRLVAAFDEAVLRVAAKRAVDRGDRLLEYVFRYRSEYDGHPTFPEVKQRDGRQTRSSPSKMVGVPWRGARSGWRRD